MLIFLRPIFVFHRYAQEVEFCCARLHLHSHVISNRISLVQVSIFPTTTMDCSINPHAHTIYDMKIEFASFLVLVKTQIHSLHPMWCWTPYLERRARACWAPRPRHMCTHTNWLLPPTSAHIHHSHSRWQSGRFEFTLKGSCYAHTAGLNTPVAPPAWNHKSTLFSFVCFVVVQLFSIQWYLSHLFNLTLALLFK